MRRIIFALLMLCSGLQAELQELHSFAELESLVDSDTLVLLDLDDTIIDVTTTLGTAHHGADLFKRLHERIGRERLSTIINRLRVHFYSEAKLCPVESCAPQIIANLQNKGIPVLGLTARSRTRAGFKYFDLITEDNVAAVDVDFTRSKLPDTVVESGTDRGPITFQTTSSIAAIRLRVLL